MKEVLHLVKDNITGKFFCGRDMSWEENWTYNKDRTTCKDCLQRIKKSEASS